MNLAFTLCSINYLAQAKTLYDSLQTSNPDWHFIIGLVDKNTKSVDLTFIDCQIVEVEMLKIDGFEAMIESYSIVELLTSVKPYYFSYLFRQFSEIKNIAYFDPDIMVLGSLKDLEEKLISWDIVLTPHFTKPITDQFKPTEKHVFQTGVFNLGFLGVQRSENSLQMLQWWERKLRNECILDLTRGLFVDQLWMNLVPVLFEKVLIDKYPGYNMAHWNLHERKLRECNKGYLVNEVPLVFYHFSHYNPSKKDEIAAFHTRYNFNTRPDLLKLFMKYRESLIANNFLLLKKIPCYYMKGERKKKFIKSVKSVMRRTLPLSLKIRLSSALRELNFK